MRRQFGASSFASLAMGIASALTTVFGCTTYDENLLASTSRRRDSSEAASRDASVGDAEGPQRDAGAAPGDDVGDPDKVSDSGASGSGAGGSAGSSGDGGGASGSDAGESAGSSGEGGEGGASGSDAGGSAGSSGTDPEEPPTGVLLNGVQWADAMGNPIHAHGGSVLREGDFYYWFGEKRTDNNRFLAISAYRSSDLMHWEFVNDVLVPTADPELASANVERPRVVYNEATQRYVMWMHWENGDDYTEARAAVASSSEIAGNYVYHGSLRPLADTGVTELGKPGYMSRDCALFIDDDGTGYFMSAANDNRDLNLYQLSSDYLEIEELTAQLSKGVLREAPVLFKRKGRYFLLMSGTTGWSPNQSEYASSEELTQGWSSFAPVADAHTYYSQPTFVLAVGERSGSDLLYLGDRWAGAWQKPVNESTYVWQPIAFPDDTTMTLTQSSSLRIDVSAGTATGTTAPVVFVHEASGLALSVEGSVDADGAKLKLSEAGSATKFNLSYDGAGYFYLVADGGTRVVDVPDESLAANIPLQLWRNKQGDHQRWRPVDLGDGRYQIQGKRADFRIGVGGVPAVGADIQQQEPLAGDEQVWRILPVP